MENARTVSRNHDPETLMSRREQPQSRNAAAAGGGGSLRYDVGYEGPGGGRAEPAAEAQASHSARVTESLDRALGGGGCTCGPEASQRHGAKLWRC